MWRETLWFSMNYTNFRSTTTKVVPWLVKSATAHLTISLVKRNLSSSRRRATCSCRNLTEIVFESEWKTKNSKAKQNTVQAILYFLPLNVVSHHLLSKQQRRYHPSKRWPQATGRLFTTQFHWENTVILKVFLHKRLSYVFPALQMGLLYSPVSGRPNLFCVLWTICSRENKVQQLKVSECLSCLISSWNKWLNMYFKDSRNLLFLVCFSVKLAFCAIIHVVDVSQVLQKPPFVQIRQCWAALI